MRKAAIKQKSGHSGAVLEALPLQNNFAVKNTGPGRPVSCSHSEEKILLKRKLKML
jgi:hypothetical protein